MGNVASKEIVKNMTCYEGHEDELSNKQVIINRNGPDEYMYEMNKRRILVDGKFKL